MGTSKSSAELGAKFTAAAYAFGKANRKAVSAAALAYKEATLASATADTGGDLKLSNWGWNGHTYRQPKLGAYYDVKGYEQATALLKPKPIGLWVFLEAGAKPHSIKPRAKGRNRRRVLADQSKGLIFGTTAMHPGVKGRKTWRRGLRAGEPVATRIFRLTHQRSLLESFSR